MRKLLLTALLASPLAALGAVNSAKMATLNDELEIMESVIDTALKQNIGRDGWRYRSLESTYLAGQGVVFNVNVGGGVTQFFSFTSDGLSSMMQVPPIPPVPPVIISGENGIEVEIDEDWEAFAEETSRQLSQVFREANSQLHDLRDQEHELAWEKRDLERRKRDLNFESRQADAERRKEIEQELKAINEEAARLEKREKELAAFSAELEQEQKARIEKQKEARDKAYKQFLSRFETSIGETLCRFGAGLRELDDAEHVSFVISNFVQSDKGKARDKVYVFSKQKIKACVQEKIDATALLSSADSYAF